MSTEMCAICGSQTIAAHSLTLDSTRRLWRICCLCMTELIAQLDRVPEPTS